MTSPLEGPEIVWSKLWGSVYALRWLFAAAFVAWTIAAVCRAMPWVDYAESVIGTLIIATFMAAVGVRTSLSAATATRAMAVTIGVWLGAWIVDIVLAFFLMGLDFGFHLGHPDARDDGNHAVPVWLFSGSWPYAWAVMTYGFYVVATLLLVADTRLRFDRIAGRMTSGRVATAVDTLIHGKPDRSLARSIGADRRTGAGPVRSRRLIPGRDRSVDREWPGAPPRRSTRARAASG